MHKIENFDGIEKPVNSILLIFCRIIIIHKYFQEFVKFYGGAIYAYIVSLKMFGSKIHKISVFLSIHFQLLRELHVKSL
jgi:hypothetical protein